MTTLTHMLYSSSSPQSLYWPPSLLRADERTRLLRPVVVLLLLLIAPAATTEDAEGVGLRPAVAQHTQGEDKDKLEGLWVGIAEPSRAPLAAPLDDV
jgi:hypothetical protein